MELSLDLSLVYVPKTVGECLKEVLKVTDCSQKLSKLADYVKRLEDERRKIDVFKRELPLCMLLLNDAILRLNEEALRYKELNDRAAMEEFRPLKKNSDEDEGMNKKNWMNSVQLWSSEDPTFDCKQQDCKSEQKQQRSEEEDDRSTCENPIQQLSNYKNREGALVPFKALVGSERTERKEEKEVVSQVTELSLMTPAPAELVSPSLIPKGNGVQQMKVQNSRPQPPPPPPQTQQQQLHPHKKQRRCWSPELHRRFVDSLQQLGGAHG